MPRQTDVQTNFTAGEFSPRLYGRVDISRYHNAAAIIENCIIYVQGGAARRPGTRFVAPAKHNDKHAVLIPYVFNEDQAYVIEFGDAYFRVFKADGTQVMDGSTPYEGQTSYAEADLDAIDYVQGADTMFLMHGNYPTSRLRRFGDASWTLDVVPWIAQPFDEIGTTPDATLTLDDASAGTGRTLTASADAWLAADVGRMVNAMGGSATITSITSTTVAVADVSVDFPSTSFTTGQWTIAGSPLASLTPSIAEPAGSAVILTLSKAGWRDEDVGKWVNVNAGLVQITQINSATTAVGNIHKILSAKVTSPEYAWILEGTVWGGYNGYPRTGTLFEQRLWLAGSPGFPQTLWGSRIAQYYNFELGTLDDDAASFALASQQINPIIHLAQIKVMLPLTYGGEFSLDGNSQTITPTNVQVRNQSAFGCNNVKPERVGNEMVFVQRGGRKVRAMSADKIVTNQYGAPDLSVLAEHVTESGITGMCYQDEPNALLWCVRGDGQIATCTIDRDQEVVGWSRQVTQGEFESVCSVPTADGEQVWALVRRTINGQTVRYIERFDPAVMTDCASVMTDETGKATWSGLDHLEGRTVAVKGDGVQLNDQVVSDGSITIERDAKTLEVGLSYTPKIKALRPEVGGQQGSSQASNLRVNRVTLRFRETTGATVNGAQAFARQTGAGVLNTPPPTVTGDVMLDTLGWDIGKWDLTIEQPQPYPFHLQAIIATITANQ